MLCAISGRKNRFIEIIWKECIRGQIPAWGLTDHIWWLQTMASLTKISGMHEIRSTFSNTSQGNKDSKLLLVISQRKGNALDGESLVQLSELSQKQPIQGRKAGLLGI